MTKRMQTSTERVFRPLPNGLYREVMLMFINFLDENGKIKSSRLDKEIPGALYRRATSERDISQWGEVLYVFPGDEVATRLLEIGRTTNDFQFQN